MNIYLLLLIFVAFILNGCTTSRQEYFEPHRARAITKLEIQAGPPERIEQIILAQLGDILLEEEFYKGKKLRKPLIDLDYFTVPTSTNTLDVCQMSTVKFHFESIEQGEPGPSSRSRVNEIEATTYYHIADGVEIDQLYNLDEDARLDMAAKCKKLDSRQDDLVAEGWVIADDEDDALEGVALLRRLHKATDQELEKLEISCNSSPLNKEESCLSLLQSIDPTLMSRVERCRSPVEKEPNISCIEIFAGEYSVAMYGQYHSTELPSRIHISQWIIMWHERVD